MNKKIDQLLSNALSKGDERKIREIYELYNSIKVKELTPYEEETFLKYVEIYFLDNYVFHLILWNFLT